MPSHRVGFEGRKVVDLEERERKEAETAFDSKKRLSRPEFGRPNQIGKEQQWNEAAFSK